MIEGTPYEVKASRTVRIRGKGGDHIKALPIDIHTYKITTKPEIPRYYWLFFYYQRHTLHMIGMREHIHRLNFLRHISKFRQYG